MQVEAAASLAPVLARYAIVVDGPLEAEVLSRIVAGGDRATSLAQLAQPFPARPDLSRVDAVGVARAVVTRLLAGGTVEHVGGGYRIADPTLAATLQRVVEAVTAATSRPAASGPVPLAGASVLPVVGEEASRLLQQGMGARWVAAPAAAAPPVPPAGVATPAAWSVLLDAGWTPSEHGGGTRAATPVVGLSSAAASVPVVRVVVADPTAPPAGVAAGLGGQRPVEVVHVPADAVRWGQGDATVARAHADHVARVLAAPAAGPRSPVVVDRGVVPAVVVLAQEQRLPPVLLVDLRAGPVVLAGGSAPPVAAQAAPASEPSAMAAVMAAAAGTSAPSRRVLARRGERRGLADLLEVLFGAGFAAALMEEEAAGDDPDGQRSGDGAGVTDPVRERSAPDTGPWAPGRVQGVVVTSRGDDLQAEALGELLGVDVVLLAAGDDLTPEVLAWLEDEDGRLLLAPQG